MITSASSRRDNKTAKYEGAEANCYTYMETGYQTPYEKSKTESSQNLYRQVERDWRREIGRARENQWNLQVIRTGKEAPMGRHNLGIKATCAWGQEGGYREEKAVSTDELERKKSQLQPRRAYQRKTAGSSGAIGYSASGAGRQLGSASARQNTQRTFVGETRKTAGVSMSYGQSVSGSGQAMPKYVMGSAVPKEDYEYEVAPNKRPEPSRRKIEKPRFEPQEIQKTQPATRRRIGRIELPKKDVNAATTGITLKRARKTIALVVAAIGILSLVVMRYSAIGKNNLAILDVKENINEVERNVEDLDLAVAMKDNLEDIQTVAGDQLNMSKPKNSQIVYVDVNKKEKQAATEEETTQEKGFDLGEFFSDLFSFLE